MTCSATSLGCSESSPASRSSSASVAPAPSGPGDRPRHHHAVAQADEGLGRRAHHRAVLGAQEVEVRARVHEPQHPVQVEGIGVEVEVEALRQHHLEDVPGPDVLLGAQHRALEGLRRHRGGDLGDAVVGSRRFQRRPAERAGQLGGELVETRPRRRRRRRRPRRRPSLRRTTTLSTSTTRWRQWSKAHSWPITWRTASGRPASSGGTSGRCSTSRTTS